MATKTTNRIQELQLDLMRQASFNDFDGERVASDLAAHRDLWRGAVLDRLGSLIKLRDIESGCWNVDTLFITPEAGRESELVRLAKKWHADELDWMDGDEACSLLGSYSQELKRNNRQILRVWWD